MEHRVHNVVVTGGAGFIGSHLTERLLRDGHAVTVVDNFATGRADNLGENPRLRIARADVAEGDAIRPLFEGADWVFHLAALADIVPSIQRPLDYHRANVDGTVAVLEAARAAGAKRFVYAASSSCYGIPDRYPTAETAPIRPMYPYALTKYLGEQYVLHWNRTYRLPCVSLRLFNVYGPRSRTTGAYGAVFGVFLAQKLAEKPFTVVGDGNQTRDFTFVTDVVDAFVRAAESDVEGEIFNVGSGDPRSVNDLVALLGGEKVHIPRRPGEPDRTHADSSRIERTLGWRPKVPFEEGVRIMLDHIELWRKAPVWDERSIQDATRDWFRYLGASHASERKS
ncbi:MAG: SDR family oxidoreductase [Planctomycetes bacterium]|nr:SDR family oxidoreductase [Planctomycetota bacterium]